MCVYMSCEIPVYLTCMQKPATKNEKTKLLFKRAVCVCFHPGIAKSHPSLFNKVEILNHLIWHQCNIHLISLWVTLNTPARVLNEINKLGKQYERSEKDSKSYRHNYH